MGMVYSKFLRLNLAFKLIFIIVWESWEKDWVQTPPKANFERSWVEKNINYNRYLDLFWSVIAYWSEAKLTGNYNCNQFTPILAISDSL